MPEMRLMFERLESMKGGTKQVNGVPPNKVCLGPGRFIGFTFKAGTYEIKGQAPSFLRSPSEESYDESTIMETPNQEPQDYSRIYQQ